MKIFKGKVVSTKLLKTAAVEVERVVVHPIYRKRFKRIRKYQVHDEIGVVVGQTVEFVASRPYSHQKKWIITKVVESKGKGQLLKVSPAVEKAESKAKKVASKKARKEGK